MEKERGGELPMLAQLENGFAFEEIDAVDAPSADSFWWGMWSGLAVVTTGVIIAT